MRALEQIAAETSGMVALVGFAEPAEDAAPHRAAAVIEPGDADWLRARILHQDEALLVLDKPAGLAVQGGTGTRRHLDGMLAALAGQGERPRLVHRLDRDTSGLLVVARSARAAAKLTEAFRRQRVDKLYWALVVGRPSPIQGLIDRPLGKRGEGRGERMAGVAAGLPAQTRYRTVARAGRIASWLALQPLSGRTHQLRAHCALLGTPIIGDGKYGGAAAHPAGAQRRPGEKKRPAGQRQQRRQQHAGEGDPLLHDPAARRSGAAPP